jgi:hypothetical protein
VAVVAHELIGIPWSVAFVLGAVVSPTDAVAPAQIIRRFGVPRRVVTVIEGENLTNDWTALTLYRFGITAVATGSFSWAWAAPKFVLTGIGGIAVGLLVGVGLRWIRRRLDDPPTEITIDAAEVGTFLGVPRYEFGLAEEQDEVGVATGAAVTSVGGDLLSIEVTIMEGKGELILTGQLGEVMQESGRAAISYARSHAADFGIAPGYFDKHTIHVHIPAGAIPKDGPSAGITIATALVSALTGRKVRKDVAMTGEMTLRGKVLPIGGLKEKTLAAHRGGVKVFVLPKRNSKDLAELPELVKLELELIQASTIAEVLDIALLPGNGSHLPVTESIA